MLTAWGKKLLKSSASNGYPAIASGSSGVPGIIEAKDAGGTTIYITATPYSAQFNFLQSMSIQGWGASTGFAVGTSDAELTSEAYDLDARIDSLSGTITTDNVTNIEDGVFERRFTITLQNNTENDIIVKEIGYYASFAAASTYGSMVSANQNDRHSIMMERHVLSEPLTVPANGAAVFRYTYIYNPSDV